MLLKLAALGALGYVGYRYYQKNIGSRREAHGGTRASAPDVNDPRVAMPGGPLSEQASVVEAGQPLPAA